MILFDPAFLNQYLEPFLLSSVSNVYESKQIVKNWNEALISGKLDKLKEEEIKSRFLSEIFGNVLGFDYESNNKWLYREEVKTQLDSTKPDGALGHFYISEDGIKNEVQIIIEVKGPNVTLDKPQNRQALKITPVDQAFLYASKMGGNCEWIVVTNLKEIRFYKNGDQGRFQRFSLTDLLDETVLKEFLFLFHRDRFFNGRTASTTKLFHLQKQQKYQVKTSKHIVDELYTCLQRFDNLFYINPNLLASIKPFNVLEDHVWHYNHYNLFSLNPEIYKLLKEIKIEVGYVVPSSELKAKLKQEEVIEYDQKLEYVFKKLNHCLIRSISSIKNLEKVKKDKKGVIGFSYRHPIQVNEENGVQIELNYPTDVECPCTICSYRSLDFRKMIKKLNDLDGKKEAITLELAYAHYLLATDNFKKTYLIYKDLELDAKGNDKKIIDYFVIKYNLLHIHNLLGIADEYEESKKDCRSVDLDRLLNDEIDLYVDDDVRQLLIEIKEDRIFDRAKVAISNIVLKLKETKELYDRGGRQWAGPNNVSLVIEQYIHVFLHIQKNFIIYDVFDEYKELVADLIEGLVCSYHTREIGIPYFQEFFVTEAILYVEPRRLQKILKDTDELLLQEQDKCKLLKKALSFFQCYYLDGVFGDPRKDDLLGKQLINHSFEEKFTNIFNNLCNVLSRIAFNLEEFKPVAIAITKFIQVDDVLAWWDIEQLGELIKKRGYLFSTDQLMLLLTVSVDAHRAASNNKYVQLIESIAVALQKYHPDFTVKDNHLVRRSILNCYYDNDRADLSTLIPLWFVLSESGQQLLSDEFEKYLDHDFNGVLYEQLLKRRIIAPNRKDYFMQLAIKVNGEKGVGYAGIKNGIAHFADYVCYNFLLIPYILDLDFNLPEIRFLENLTPFEQWLANPIDFDYKHFKVEWVKAVGSDAVWERLCGDKVIGDFIATDLKERFDEHLARVYFGYFA